MGNLIEEIRSGNKDAVKAVYQEYAKDVYNFAKSITGEHDSALAATKKTFVKLFNTIKKGENPDNIRTALLKVAYDEACNIAMPPKEEVPDNVVTPTPVREAGDTRRMQREEIYMPKGGYDSLQVDADKEGETMIPETEEEEIPRPKHQRRPRPVAPVEEEMPRQRRPRPVIAPVEEVEEGEADEEYLEEAPAPKARKRRRSEEEEITPVRRRKSGDKDPVVFDALEEEDDEKDYDAYDDEDIEYEKPRNKGLFVFCIILNVILILILLWFLGGLLINLGVLPEFDLGYTWFNAHIYPLF